MRSVSIDNTTGRSANFCALAAGLLVFFSALGGRDVGSFKPIGSGLDASFLAVLGEAAAHGEKFGRDLIMTGGPLSALYSGYFDSVQWPWVVFAGILIAAVLAWSCGRLASNWPVAVLFPALILLSSPDAVLMSIPTLAALAVLVRPKASSFLVLLAAIATAAVMLAKFSVLPVAVVAFVVIDIAFLRAGRLPVGIIAFLAAVTAWFAILQGNLTYLFEFLRFSVETSVGYSAAMSTDGNHLELIVFIVLAAGFFGLALYARYKPAISRPVFEPMLSIVVLGAFCFTGFKSGFVRHDLHSLIAWGVLALASAGYAGLADRRPLRWVFIALSVTSAALALDMIYSQFGISPVSSIERRWQSAGDSLAKLSELAINPAGWFRQQRMMMENGRASLRAAMPLPKLQGSVDALRASVLSAMIAAGLEYRPRFTVQEYTTYTQALIAKNRESWFGPRSPDHILFGLEPIDRRYPALSEGSLWPDLLRFYEPTQRITNNLVVLSRRRQPLPEILGAPITSTVRLGEGFAIGPDPTFVTLDIRLNWLGRLLSFLLKPPIVHLKFEYARGASGPDDYRVIPTIAREGFIISPRVDTADGYVDLAIGDKTAFGPSRSPVAARIIVDPIGSWAYDGSVNVTLRQIDTTILEHYRPDMSNW